MCRHPRSASARADAPKSKARSTLRLTALAAAIGILATSAETHAERWTTSASVGATESYNHYSGAGQPSDGSTTSVTGALTFDGEGGRVKLRGSVSATEVFYAGQGASNSFAPAASVFGEVEAIEKFFWVDATANVSQSYFSPFGPQPPGLSIPTVNRYTSETYSVSPFIKGVLASSVSYSVRDDNIWTTSQNYGDSSIKPPSTYGNNLDAELSSVTSGKTSWNAQYQRQFYDSGTDTGNYTLQLGRLVVTYSLDPQLQVSARGGYELDKFPQQSAIGNSTQGSFYGAGAHWRPSERTDINGWWEHHYYGSSYSWTITHRLPNVALSANFTRGLSSFPQSALLVPAGVPLSQFLDAAFTTRIPDPVQRAAAVAQFLAQSGLPPTLASPLNVYATTVTLQTTSTLSAVWVGVLNSVSLSLYRSESESVVNQTALPEPFVLASNSIQTGGSASYSRRVTALTSFVATAGYSTAKPTASGEVAGSVRTHNYNASASLSTSFSPKTTGSVGVSYYIFDAENLSGHQSTLSLFASISHTF